MLHIHRDQKFDEIPLGGGDSLLAKFAKFCDFGNSGNLRIFAKFAKFCALYSAPCNTLFVHVRLFFLMSEIPLEENAWNELVVALDDDATDAPAKKKAKLKYGALPVLRKH